MEALREEKLREQVSLGTDYGYDRHRPEDVVL